MPTLILEPRNYAEIHARLATSEWNICCLCAAWCDVCTAFRERFDLLASQHPDKLMLWIDIEDRADLVDEFDVEDFPTLLIQRGEEVFFYGAIEPDLGTINRLIGSQTRASAVSQTSAPAHGLRAKLGILRQG